MHWILPWFVCTLAATLCTLKESGQRAGKRGTHCTGHQDQQGDTQEGDTLQWTPKRGTHCNGHQVQVQVLQLKCIREQCDDASDVEMTLNCFAFNLTISTTRRQDRIKANLCPLFRRQVGKAIEQGSLDAEQVEHKCFYLAHKLQVS